MRLTFTTDQVLTLGCAAIYAACSNTDVSQMSPEDQGTILILNEKAVNAMSRSPVTPTELKDIGLDLIRKAIK